MPGTRDRLLAVMRDLAVREGTLPSMDAVARAAGVSKGGLIHHFPTRAALIEAFVDDLLERALASLAEAAERTGGVAGAWLESSTEESDELELYRVLYAAAQTPQALGERAHRSLSAFNDRVAALLAAELGDPLTALAIRMLGDGLFLNALTGTPVAVDERDALIARVRAGGLVPGAAAEPARRVDAPPGGAS